MQLAAAGPLKDLASLPLLQGDAQNDAAERQWLQETLAWLQSFPPELRSGRLRDLGCQILAGPELRERFERLWARAYPARLFSEAALPEPTSLLRELMARLRRRVLPQIEEDLDLYAALQAAELTDGDAAWIAGLNDEDIGPWRELLGQSASGFPVAIRLLALRAAAIGLSRSVMQVMPHQYETEAPFFDLADAAARFARAPQSLDMREQLREVIVACRLSAGLAHARMEEHGVSTDLVFRLDLVFSQLQRIEALLRVIEGVEDARRLAAMLVRAVARERGPVVLVRNSINRLARQVVTHTGRSGEHYIAGSRSEWSLMGYGAIGAGAITAFTALFKYYLAGLAMAPLWTGLGHSLNYTLSFVLMQFLGWKLASKMPAMTAAALCDALNKDDGMQTEMRLVTAIARTQTVVTIGNLLGAIPLAFLIDFAIHGLTGHPFLSEEAARHGVASMHLWRSFTVPFAALTGGFLWLSSLVAGWTENWILVHRLPAGIEQSRRARRWLGAGRAARLGRLTAKHMSGVAGYVALGLMLGLLPFVGVFAGVPLEVRHITLASASLAYDWSALAWQGGFVWRDAVWAMLGLIATGVLNFSVSFALGLWLAVRVRNLDTGARRQLLVALWNELRRHPARFLWRHDAEPERTAASVAA